MKPILPTVRQVLRGEAKPARNSSRGVWTKRSWRDEEVLLPVPCPRMFLLQANLVSSTKVRHASWQKMAINKHPMGSHQSIFARDDLTDVPGTYVCRVTDYNSQYVNPHLPIPWQTISRMIHQLALHCIKCCSLKLPEKGSKEQQ